MAQDITLSMDGMLLNWIKQVGDTVKTGEVIAEFEADKATVEVVSSADGVLVELLTEVGEEVEEGSVIARVGEAGAAPSEAPASEEAAPEPKSAAPEPKAAPQTSSNGAAARTEDGRIKASPLAKRIASDRGIDLDQVQGSGPGGRIVKTDIESFDPAAVQKPDARPAQSAPTAPAQPMAFQSYGDLPEGDDVEINDVTRMRKLIAQGTLKSVNSTPQFYVTMETDVAALLKLRAQLNEPLAEQGIKISVNDLVVKAVALSLRQFPNLNSHFYGDKIVRHKRINISMAVALPDSALVNVVSHDADKTTLSTMAANHKQIFDDVRDGKIKSDYIKGGTFLVSNLGAYGVEAFTAIIDPPQSGALAVGAAQKIPVVLEDGSLGIGQRMKVTLTVDHRISDGAEGAQFLQYFKGLIENPMRLLV